MLLTVVAPVCASAFLLSVDGGDADARRQAVEARLIPPTWVEDVPVSLAERMRELAVPGVSIAVVEGGRLDWAAGYGVRDADSGQPVTTGTLFQAGSISKPLAALAALRMVERGDLDLDAPVRGYLRSWTLPETPYEAEVPLTLRHLLSHTGGTTVHGFAGYGTFQSVPSVPALLSGALPANSERVTLDRRPGIGARYSGGGTTIAQLALMDVSGEPFAALADELALAPLGMTRSTYQQPLDVARWPDHSAGHDVGGAVHLGRFRIHPEQAAAGLWTTPSDLARFAVELQRAWRGESKVLSRQLAASMLTPVSGKAGLGLFLEQHAGETWFGHGGSNMGFKNTLFASRDDGRAVCVMTNGDQGSRLADELVRAVAHVYEWDGWVEPPLSTEYLDEDTRTACVGRFAGGSDEVFLVELEGEELVLEAVPDRRYRMAHLGEARFLVPGAGLELAFSEVEEDGFLAVTARQGGAARNLTRLPAGEHPPAELLARGEIDAGIAALRARFVANPGASDVAADRLNDLALGFSYVGQAEAGLALARLAVELHPGQANGWGTLGELLVARGLREEALDAYAVCLELLAEDPSAAGDRWMTTHVPAVHAWLQAQTGE